MRLTLERNAMTPWAYFISSVGLFAATLFSGAFLLAQSVEFDVVSIKRNNSGSGSGGIRPLPDGTLMMTNQPMRSLIDEVSSEPVLPENIVGMPSWMTSEKYDLTVKPPVGATREQM